MMSIESLKQKWASRKLWVIIGFGGISAALQYSGTVSDGTWQVVCLAVLGYVAGQSWVDQTKAKNGNP